MVIGARFVVVEEGDGVILRRGTCGRTRAEGRPPGPGPRPGQGLSTASKRVVPPPRSPRLVFPAADPGRNGAHRGTATDDGPSLPSTGAEGGEHQLAAA
jgi:hypothetical protein